MSKPSSDPIQYIKAFGYAIDGLVYVLKYHASFIVESLLGLLAIVFGLAVGISRVEWLVLVTTIFTVLVAELLNTSIEVTLDYMAVEHHLDVKKAKDIAAGGVFFMSLGAIVIGMIIFIPHIMQLLTIK